MRINSSLVILDSKDQILETIENCDLISFRNINYEHKNIKKINVNLLNEKHIFNQKKKYIKKKKEYLSKIKKIFPEIEMHSLEIFNLRNDKENLYNKIFYFDLIKVIIKKNKYKYIKIFSDNKNSEKLYKSLINNTKLTKLDIINTSSYEKKKNYYLSFINFSFKTLLTIIVSKIASRQLHKNFKNACLSFFPIFYNHDKNENFFNQKFLKLNFLITDETHLNGTILNNIKKILSTRNIENFIIVEKYISFTHLILFFFKSFLILKKFYLIKKLNFHFNGLNLTDEITNYSEISIFNALKLHIYKDQLKNIFLKYNIKNFHYYMFEYNFGFFLSNEIRKNMKKVKLVGYQHGIFSEKLMWLDLFKSSDNKLRILPDEIIVKYSECLSAYKKVFKNKIFSLNKSTAKNINLKISKQKKYRNRILVLLGLHDSQDMINKLFDICKLKKEYIFLLKFHPKNKNELKLTNKNIKVINNINNIKFGSIILSQTSTLVYDMINVNLRFKLLKMNNKINLLTDKIQKRVKYIN